MLTTGNTLCDNLLRSGAYQKAQLNFTFSDNTTLTIYNGNIMQKGITIDRSAITGSVLEVGTTVSADLTAKIYNPDGKYDNYSFEGSSCQVVIYATANGTEYSVSLGYFTIDGVNQSGQVLTLTGLDCMAALDIPYTDGDISSSLFPMSLSTLLSNINTKLTAKGIGVQIEYNSSRTGMDIIVSAMPTETDMTYRNIIGWIFQLLGGNVVAKTDEKGKIKGRWYLSIALTTFDLYVGHRVDGEISKNGIAISQISVNGTVYGTATSNNYVVNVQNNPLFDLIPATSGSWSKNDVATLILTAMQLGTLNYHTMSAKTLPCPLYEPMDSVTYYEDDTNSEITVLTDVSYTLNGNVSLSSQGLSTELNKTQTSAVTQGQAAYISTEVQKAVESQADYVVEQGTSGGWTYRKWNSGFYECWKTVFAYNLSASDWTYIAATSTSSAFYKIQFADSKFALPVTFADTNYKLQVQSIYNEQLWTFGVGKTISTFGFTIGRWASLGAATLGFDVYAAGYVSD